MNMVLVGVIVVIIGGGLLIALYCVSIYNNLVKLKNEYKNGFSQIDVQLQRRYDLIPNLVNTAKAFMEHEKETLMGVIGARNQALKNKQTLKKNPEDSKAVKDFNIAEANLNKSISGMFALFENYPDLKSDSTMTNLMEELSSTENKISFARQAYNDAIMHYNVGIQQFPNNILAGIFNFGNVDQLELENQEARKAVKVEF